MQRVRRSFTGLMVILIVMIPFILGGCAGKTVKLEPGMHLIKGKLKKVDPAEYTITIKPPKGERVKLTLTGETELISYDSMTEMSKDQPVEAVFREDGEKNLAVSVKRLPQGSCQ